ncbi:unnamed protein product, partial [Gulo gulo]
RPLLHGPRPNFSPTSETREIPPLAPRPSGSLPIPGPVGSLGSTRSPTQRLLSSTPKGLAILERPRPARFLFSYPQNPRAPTTSLRAPSDPVTRLPRAPSAASRVGAG